MKDERDGKGKMGKDVAGARGVLWAEVAKAPWPEQRAWESAQQDDARQADRLDQQGFSGHVRILIFILRARTLQKASRKGDDVCVL